MKCWILGRSNKKEKQEYAAIVDRQRAIGKRMAKIGSEQERLTERLEKNKYPESKPFSKTKEMTIEEIRNMSNEELHSWSEQMKKETEEIKADTEIWTEKFDKWKAESDEIFSNRTRLIEESITLKNEFYDLEEKEKWLLLSIALRSQPTLMKYMETNPKE